MYSAIDRIVSSLLIGIFNLWHYCLAPFTGVQCRFHPSCSRYAVEALRQHGCLHGSSLALRRIFRCNPRYEGGLDPVPPRRK